MATISTAARNAACDAVVDLLDVGGAGTLRFTTNASPQVAVATLTFNSTAFGNASTGVATANAITSDTNAAGGTAGLAQLRNNAGTVVIDATVGTSGQDINLSSVSIGSGDTVSVSSLTVTMPAS